MSYPSTGHSAWLPYTYPSQLSSLQPNLAIAGSFTALLHPPLAQFTSIEVLATTASFTGSFPSNQSLTPELCIAATQVPNSFIHITTLIATLPPPHSSSSPFHPSSSSFHPFILPPHSSSTSFFLLTLYPHHPSSSLFIHITTLKSPTLSPTSLPLNPHLSHPHHYPQHHSSSSPLSPTAPFITPPHHTHRLLSIPAQSTRSLAQCTPQSSLPHLGSHLCTLWGMPILSSRYQTALTAVRTSSASTSA